MRIHNCRCGMVLVGLLAVVGCSDPGVDQTAKPGSGPSVPPEPDLAFMDCLPADSAVVVLVDTQEAVRLYREVLDELLNSPICRAAPEARTWLQRGAADIEAFLAGIVAALGVDPFKDLSHIVFAGRLTDEGMDQFLLGLHGRFPADLSSRLTGAKAIEGPLAGVAQYGPGSQVWIKDSTTVFVGVNTQLQQVLSSECEGHELRRMHPQIAAMPTGTLLQVSTAALPTVCSNADDPGRPVILRAICGGVRHTLVLGKTVRWAFEAKTEEIAAGVAFGMDTLRGFFEGGPQVMRAMALSPFRPTASEEKGWFQTAVEKNPQAWIDTIDEVLPVPEDLPAVQRAGRFVSWEIPRGSIRGGLAVFGMSAWVAYSAYKTIQEKERRIEEGWDPVPVVVAIKNLTAGTELNYDHVAKKMIPSQVVTPNTILPPDFEKVIGKKLKVSVVRGDTLLWSMFSQEIFEAEVLPKSPEPEEPPAVVVAIQDLAVGTALDYGIIAKMRMEKEKQPSGAVTPKDVEGLLGGKLLVPVKRGEILLKSMLAPKKK